MTSSKSNYLPNAPFPNTTTIGVMFSTYEFVGDINIQFTTKILFVCLFLNRASTSAKEPFSSPRKTTEILRI